MSPSLPLPLPRSTTCKTLPHHYLIRTLLWPHPSNNVCDTSVIYTLLIIGLKLDLLLKLALKPLPSKKGTQQKVDHSCCMFPETFLENKFPYALGPTSCDEKCCSEQPFFLPNLTL